MSDNWSGKHFKPIPNWNGQQRTNVLAGRFFLNPSSKKAVEKINYSNLLVPWPVFRIGRCGKQSLEMHRLARPKYEPTYSSETPSLKAGIEQFPLRPKCARFNPIWVFSLGDIPPQPQKPIAIIFLSSCYNLIFNNFTNMACPLLI